MSCSTACLTFGSLDQWEAAIKAFEKKHRALAAGVAETLQEEVRRNVIKDLRGTITEPEHRFFLALLMNAPSRSDLARAGGAAVSSEKAHGYRPALGRGVDGSI